MSISGPNSKIDPYEPIKNLKLKLIIYIWYDINIDICYFCRIFYELDMDFLFELALVDVIRLFCLNWDVILSISSQF